MIVDILSYIIIMFNILIHPIAYIILKKDKDIAFVDVVSKEEQYKIECYDSDCNQQKGNGLDLYTPVDIPEGHEPIEIDMKVKCFAYSDSSKLERISFNVIARSSTSVRYNTALGNNIALFDYNYDGSVKLYLTALPGTKRSFIPKGTRIVQVWVPGKKIKSKFIYDETRRGKKIKYIYDETKRGKKIKYIYGETRRESNGIGSTGM